MSFFSGWTKALGPGGSSSSSDSQPSSSDSASSSPKMPPSITPPAVPPSLSGAPPRRPKEIDTTKLTGFDPTFLERGAKALKEIDQSGSADKVLEMLAQEERTKQLQEQNKALQNQLALQQAQEQRNRSQEEERRRTDQNRAQLEQSRASHQAKVEKEKQQQIQQMQQRTNQDWLDQQHKMFQKQQEMLRKTEAQRAKHEEELIEKKANLDMKVARVKEEARATGNIRQERENADVHRKSMEQRMSLDRTTQIELQKERYKFIQSYTNNVFNLITDPHKLSLLVLGVGGMSLAYFGSKIGLGVLGRYVETRLGKPSLVRETSRLSYRHPHKHLRRYLQTWWGKTPPRSVFQGLVLPPNLTSKLTWLATATQNTAHHHAPYRNILLFGNPGTGKTLFAKKLAYSSGLDYAIMTGGDFAQLGRDAVTELHKVFDWAEHSRSGTLIFIDEADAFLRKGRGEVGAMGEDMRNALSAYLYRTGQSSNKFMIVLASNLPNTLDAAVVDRIDESIHFPLPSMDERRAMFKFYIQEHITKVSSHSDRVSKVFTEPDSKEMLALYERLARKTDGVSGRGISKLVIAIRAAVYSGQSAEPLSIETAEIVVDETLKSDTPL